MSRQDWTALTVALEDDLVLESQRSGTTVIALARERRETCDSPVLCGAIDQIIAHHSERIAERASDRARMWADE